ncbi:helix-turn-helix domain-containing protein [Melghirimyces algeriensis]|uniref:Zn-dependent peptidase ImmA, M78 family n=1 Tax=Melghirimyces algeriensis TaxID=910412 RepID=A0A521FC38_9BACL|nr:XRE family transcriptional regulator [Melghirimyces algeriensis]SMO93644.1 Zn-dependent peptidase ImmA, M78 family [Melghirimyces algeriensis]
MNIGSRIRLARVRAGLTMQELANQVGVSKTAVSKFEKGETAPRQSTLLRLAKSLSVGVEFFFREVKVDTIAPAYRKHSKIGKRLQETIEAKILETVERYLMVDDLFPDELSLKEVLPQIRINSVKDAELAANELREKWKLGTDPIDDLCGRLEKSGVKVIAIEGPKGFDGFSCWVKNDAQVPVIAFNVNVPGDRQRFNLAHELGHLVHDESPDVDIEKAAHRFAGAFLVPDEAVYAELGKKRSNLSFNELRLLKRKYGVSIQLWIRRAYDLKIIDKSTYTSLFRRLSARGWRSEEPEHVAPEKPYRLDQLVHRALAEKLVTPSFAATLLNKTPQSLFDAETMQLSEPSSDLVKQYAENEELTAFEGAALEDLYE